MPPEVTPDVKPRPRIMASRTVWKKLRLAKDGPCRICGTPPPNELHHLYSRARGGDDVAANLVPLCTVDHDRVTCLDPVALRVLFAALTDVEYEYVEATCGVERIFGASL